MTYDRGGHRRLGALLEGEVVDLPDAVGHPAFPTTMEALVARNGGTVLAAARAALERDEAGSLVVAGARLLAPLLPASLRSVDARDGARRVLGPDEEVPWPTGAGWLEYRPKVAAVLRRPIQGLTREEAADAVFGYTLVADFAVRDASGDPTPRPEGLPVALGPCVVTPDEVEPQAMALIVRVDGEPWAKGSLNGAARDLLDTVAWSSRLEELLPGETFATSPFDAPGVEQRIWPGALVELEAEGLGTLRTRI
ncbi:MAG: fumarylacetoacetate hydrolase family protein, partial [Candidatus Velamenicoccus archaeovorus]